MGSIVKTAMKTDDEVSKRKFSGSAKFGSCFTANAVRVVH